jgi:hypothetical protein
MMAGQSNKPKQLQLELQLGYLRQINSHCEKMDFYETMTQALLGAYIDLPERGPLWDEINRPR